MTYEDDLRGPKLIPQRLYASIFVVAALGALYWHFSGQDVSDWLSYSQLFDREGGWLERQGRDPLFVALIHGARWLFGVNGYEEFRFALFCVFAAFGAWVAYAMPSGRTWAVLLALIVVTAIVLKSLVQIREGAAFMLLTVPVVGVFTHGRTGWIKATLWAVLAVSFHSGMVLFLGACLMAAVIYYRESLLAWRGLPWVLLVLGVATGAAVSAAIFASARSLEFSLQDFGVDTNAEAVGGIWKNAYWAGMGVAVLIAWRGLLAAACGSQRFGYAYATVLGSFVLPVIYTVCVELVFSQFYLPAITSMVIRLLFSGLQLGIVIIGLRGKVNLPIIGVTLLLLGDQARLLLLENLPEVPH